MRVLIAFDGSTEADTAIDLAGTLAWPAGSLIRLVEVVPTPPLLAGGAALLSSIDENASASLAASVGRLRRDGITVEPRLVRGDAPANVLVLEARALDADLIIVGHRGHGALATVFLGSVARDIAESASCPVLVARRATCDRLLFAEDGSESAYEARRVLATWPIFHGKRVQVVSVAHVRRPLLSGITAGVSEDARATRADDQMETRVAYRRLATEAAEELRIAGLRVTTEVRDGDPAEQLAAAARDSDADLVVVGTRGRGGMTRALLGSVARSVLLSAPCSVLVVRQRG